MTVEAQNTAVSEQKPNDKEFNFRQIEKRLQEERAEKQKLEAEREKLSRELETLRRNQPSASDDDDDDSEPYIDKKKLKKEQAKFGQQIKQETKSEIQQAVRDAIYEERRKNFLDTNADFYDVLQHADKFVQKAPHLAETILKMPDTFERQQLVYHNIKTLGLDKPEVKPPSIQDKIDANRRSPYYQPSGIASSPYAPTGDFSEAGKKQAYEQVQQLKARMRLG